LKFFCKNKFAGFAIAASVFFATTAEASFAFITSLPKVSSNFKANALVFSLTQPQDTAKLPYPLKQDNSFATEKKTRSSFDLETPSNITVSVEYDPKAKQYIIYERVGKYNIKPPRVMTEDEYRSYQFENSMREYWRKKSAGESFDAGNGLLPRMQVNSETFDRIFGSNVIEIIPEGSAELSFGLNHTKSENPGMTIDQQKSTTFDFKSKIQMNVNGKVGDKLKMTVQYNTEATFDFENNVKVEYTGYEDEIIQKIEAGNVSLPLPGTLITGSQSLFGFKTQLKFGRLNITSVISKQNGQSQVIEVKGGAQTTEFSINADEYDANKHYFLSPYFRNKYNGALSELPIVNTNVRITKVEVWITNNSQSHDNSRDVIAFVDLGESKEDLFETSFTASIGSPHNSLNNLYEIITSDTIYRKIQSLETNMNNLLKPNLKEGRGCEKIQLARKLLPNEYSVNTYLGYISLNSTLGSNQQLAVAYEYTIDGQRYQVGEFSTDGIDSPKALFLKLLAGMDKSPKIKPLWNLMMKNIYKLGNVYQVSKEDFLLDVYYHDDKIGTDIRYLTEGGPGIANTPLISLLNLDRLNSQNDQKPDGIFDFMDDVSNNTGDAKVPITINSQYGRIIFPLLEPFGKDLRAKIKNSALADKYVYQEIYDSTLNKAQKVSRKNKFKIAGSLRSATSSEISLNAANVPKGSVVVTAGGAKLQEGTDYTVDYNLGSVRIIKPGLIESGMPIRISLENNALFNFQTKTLIGTHLDYKISDKFNIGATVMNLTERPLTQKVNFGNEAISNTIWGLNTSFETESSFLTKMVDFLPLIQTKEKSKITFDAEFAQLLPGYSKSIGKNGTVFIDDFESSSTPFDLTAPLAWKLASIPKGQTNYLFPDASYYNDIKGGFHRAQLAWFRIDPLFLRQESLNPSYIRNNDKLRSSHWVREVYEKELFPYKNTPQGQPTNIPVLNLTFYPYERGPYNYNPTLTTDGLFPSNTIKDNWGGIMRGISNSDFEAQNINYIEFWLMDPFVYDTINDWGGDLYFNLGTISEDILPDGHYAYEGALPYPGKFKDFDTTSWGRQPMYTVQNYFNQDNKKYQDIGLDGLSSRYDIDGDGVDDEIKFFSDYLNKIQGIVGANPSLYEQFTSDPSNDDYRYFLDPYYTTVEASILDRYKKVNNTEGNSASSTSTNQQATQLADGESIDDNLSHNTIESYYQYKVSLRHEDMVVGKNFITSKVVAYADMPAYSKKQKVSWYQFKVPIDKPERTIGDPSFTNITGIRMILKGFTDTLNLRFAKLQFIRDEWRKYDSPMVEGQEGMPTSDLSNGLLNISAVNLEENSNRTPINYVLPPKLSRSTDPSQSQTVELNEQSMELKVTDLAEGDARAAIKNINYDIRKYRKLKMDVHAEEIPGFPIKDDEATVFLRLGTDNTDNYYEYEVPLKITPPPPGGGRYSNNSETDRQTVWPSENMLDIDLEKFTNTKLARNDAKHKSGSNVSMSTIFVTKDGDNRVKVKGNPSLSDIRVLMIGVRNPGKSNDPNSDGLSKSVIIWVNELRVSNTTNESGWAANARLSAKLADLGTVAITGATSKPGFGSIESKVADRTSEDFYQYDLTTTMEVGRFFPSKWGVKIPMYFGYGESFSNPQYNPLDPDIPLRTSLKRATSKGERDTIKNFSQDYTRRKSINFTNVKIERQDAKNWPLAISNFSVSYSYNETFSRNIKIDHKVDREIRGALTYNYNTNLKPIFPLKKVNFLNSKYLRLIKDFNFSPLPSQFSFRTELVRNYFEQQLRNISNTSMQFEPTYSKDFMWNRVYSLNWDITQSLRFDFNANNVAIIDEPEGIVDRKYRNSYDHWRDSVIHNILNFGRNKEYTHQFNFTYNLPLNKIPIIDWTAVSAKYSGNYRWESGPILADTSKFDPGNKIQNSNIIQITGQLNLIGLYNKLNYLKLLNQKFDQIGRGVPPKKAMKTVKFEESGLKLKANQSKSINHKLKTETVTVKVFNDKGAEIKVKMDVKSDERITIKADNDYENIKVVVEGKVPERINPLKVIAESSIRLMMGLKNVSVSLSDNRGMYVPGYKPTTRYMGLNDVNGVYAPGLAFISGWQDPEFAWYAINHGWLTKDTTFNEQFRLTYSENVTFRALYEPMPNFKVEINAIRSYSRNQNQTYSANEFGQYQTSKSIINGNYSISIISAGSAFKSPVKVFNRFKESRLAVASRLYRQRDKHALQSYEWGTGKFPTGYGELSQQVLIPAFLSAYSHYSPKNVPLGNFPAIPMPNWQITYDGLAKLGFFKDYFRTFTLTHGYRSVYSIGAYSANLNYKEEEDGYNWIKNSIGDFISQRDITNVSIIEQFSPLIGLDMNWVNNLTTRFEVKTSRSLAMSFSNNQLTQTNAWEYIIGGGYRFENMPLIFGPEEGKQRTLKSDLRLRLDFSIRNNETVLHKMVEEISIKNAGMITTSVKASADYQISTQVTFRAFFDWGKTKPTASSLSYPQINSSFGFSLRFTMM